MDLFFQPPFFHLPCQLPHTAHQFPTHTMEFNDQNFEQEILNFQGAALVDFFATWCGPCQVQGPIIEGLAAEMAGQPVKVGKVNVDQAPNTAQKYDVMSIPTLVFFKNGQVVETLTGLQSKDALRDKLVKLI